MRIRCPLCALILAVAGAQLLSAGTIINESITCQSIQLSTGAVVATDSHSIVIETSSVNVPMSSILPGCSTPLGSMDTTTTFLLSAIMGPGQLNAAIFQNGQTILQSNPQYQLSALIDIHFTQQQTFVATGGTGIGVLHGMTIGDIDGAGGYYGSLPQTVSITTSVGTNTSGLIFPYTYQFVFGQPFTMEITADYVINPVTMNGHGDLLGQSVDVEFDSGYQTITDANGNHISASFTVVPEPSTFALLAAALVMVAVSAARKYAGR